MDEVKLKATRYDYRLEDDSGYAFDVAVVHDPEFGWESSVSFSAHGLVGPDEAVQALRCAVEHFLRQMPEARTK